MCSQQNNHLGLVFAHNRLDVKQLLCDFNLLLQAYSLFIFICHPSANINLCSSVRFLLFSKLSTRRCVCCLRTWICGICGWACPIWTSWFCLNGACATRNWVIIIPFIQSCFWIIFVMTWAHDLFPCCIFDPTICTWSIRILHQATVMALITAPLQTLCGSVIKANPSYLTIRIKVTIINFIIFTHMWPVVGRSLCCCNVSHFNF